MNDGVLEDIESVLSAILNEQKKIATALEKIAAHFSATTSTKEN